VTRVPPPHGDPSRPLRALIFDSHYDAYRGVITYVRVVDGEIIPRTKIRMMNTDSVHEVDEVGWFAPRPRPAEKLTAGEVGYVTAAIKNVVDARVGDTLTTAEHGATEALPGYRRVKPMVFAGLFPTNSDQFSDLKEALEKLQLNEGTLWAGSPHDYTSPEGLDALPEIRRLVFAGEWGKAQALVDAKFLGRPARQMQYQTVGDLTLHFPEPGEVSDYRRELDLDTAVARVVSI